MKRSGRILLVLVLLFGLLFVFRHSIFLLDSFHGTIVEKSERTVATVRDGQGRPEGKYTLVVETDDGRQVQVDVEQVVFFAARAGMRIQKRPFRWTIDPL